MDPSSNCYREALQSLSVRMSHDNSMLSAMGSEFMEYLMAYRSPSTGTAEEEGSSASTSAPRTVPLYDRRGYGFGRSGDQQERGATSRRSESPMTLMPPGLGSPNSSNSSIFSMLNSAHQQNDSDEAMGSSGNGSDPFPSTSSNGNDWRRSPDRGASSSCYGSQHSPLDWSPFQSQLFSRAQARAMPENQEEPGLSFLRRRFQSEESTGSDGAAAGSSSSFNNPGRFTPTSVFGPVPLFDEMPHVAPKAGLNVYPEKVINFSKCHISFRVQAINLPLDVPLDAYMVEGIVITPGGKLLCCHIRQEMKTNIYQPDSFMGTFKCTDEVGNYQLRVRLILPISLWGTTADNGVIGDEAQILISRNYYRESLNESPVSFQVEFEPWSHFSWSSRSSVVSDRDSPTSASKAWGLACDKGTNRLFYTDRTGNSFSCIDSERGETIFKVSPSNSTGVILNRPTGICCDEVNRRVLVADKDNHRICIFSMSGEFVTTFGGVGHTEGNFNYPWDVAVSPDGSKIAVSDSRNKRLQLFDKHGMFMGKFSVFETSPFEYKNNFDYPRGVTFNKEGTLIYMSDFNANNIMEVPIDMKSYRKVLPEGKLKRPQGLVVDSLDSILVCDSKNKCVRHVYPHDGQILAQINSIARERLEFPVNITLLGDGRLAVLDAHAKIRIF